MIASIMLSEPQSSQPRRPLTPERQLLAFVDALFEPSDLVEIRGIASPLPHSKDPGRLVLRCWERADSVGSLFRELKEANESGANLYFGVNPRSVPAGTKDAIALCRPVWADLDRISLADAASRWRALSLPEPTVVVNSGHGIHVYWKLDAPVDVSSVADRQAFESLLKNLYRSLGSDATQDVSRLLRLPGFLNVKDAPVPCELVRHTPKHMYPLSVFQRWMVVEDAGAKPSGSTFPSSDHISTVRLSESLDVKRIRGLIAALDKDVEDRSRRDFWVVCRLVELGLSADEIGSLVAGRSKFTTDAYLHKTLENVLRTVGQP
ncbi:MAG: hypothetical protein KF861_15480 [Planctomycetaceae bacterium]|nr:hypothetical protein [Planctomycetaceae bacterium]